METGDLASGGWYRFDEYEMRDGCIAPKPGAAMHFYDPWSLDDRPYRSLMEMVRDPAVLNLARYNKPLISGVLEWCGRFGLLGVLSHRTRAATMWPRWQKVAENLTLLQVQQIRYVHLTGAWLTSVKGFGIPREKGVNEGDAVPEADWPEDAQPVAVLTGEVEGSDLKSVPLDTAWGDYFPDVQVWERKTFAYPAPNESKFRRMYGEPIWEFVRSAWALRNGFDAITTPAAPEAPTQGAARLTQLASNCWPKLEVVGETFANRWISGSLLSSMSLMVMQDLANHAVAACQVCGTIFKPTGYQSKYCSARCRNTMQKRNSRKAAKGRSGAH
jgi:predicted nucleic acid-binding Zn ribbon protein